MSEKIVLTVEQDEAIKKITKDKLNLNHLSFYAGRFNENYDSLNNLTVDQFARILYEPNSYEVEQPPFEVGDWVTRIKDSANEKPQFREGKTFKVDEADENIVVSDCTYHNKASLRHATKEEIMWAELGREVGEFADDDLIVTDDRNLRVVTMQGVSGSAKKLYENGSVKGFYPANSFIKLP